MLLGVVDKFGTYLLFVFCGSYHIAGSMGVFYAREPYLNVDSSHVTRFLGLAQVGNKNKQVIVFASYSCHTSLVNVSRFWFLSALSLPSRIFLKSIHFSQLVFLYVCMVSPIHIF